MFGAMCFGQGINSVKTWGGLTFGMTLADAMEILKDRSPVWLPSTGSKSPSNVNIPSVRVGEFTGEGQLVFGDIVHLSHVTLSFSRYRENSCADLSLPIEEEVYRTSIGFGHLRHAAREIREAGRGIWTLPHARGIAGNLRFAAQTGESNRPADMES